ncbi:glycosyltransferase family 4 protein [Halobaculum sp. MBLA0143]|uniref:glycosyltransferase family 4 protein n=1 Tax=Halobaculum sp. MBLA0143 TaxID=3079933 RepID=UPI003523FC2B
MRVAVVSMYTPAHRDGPAVRRTRRVAEGLAARGHDVAWLCSQWWDGTDREFRRNDVRYRAVTQGPAAGSFRSKLPVALRRVGADVVHAVADPPGHATTAATTGRVLRTPVVVDWWDPDDGSRKVARKPTRLTAPSEFVRTAVREHGADEDTVRVVPEGVDYDLIRAADVDERTDLVYVRDRIDRHANVEGFLLALAELRDRDWRATVIGDGPGRAAAERAAADLRIDDRVTFLGRLPPAEFVPILKGAHVCAQTATREPFASGLLWALACGCVGIVQYQAGSSAHELVENADRGRRVTDPQELADEIVGCRSVSRETIDDSFTEFDHDAVLDRFTEVYEAADAAFGLF